MAHSNRQRRARQIESLRRQFAQSDGFPFADVLSAQQIEVALREEKATWREEAYTPLLTLWAFLSQVVCPDGSCRAAVARVLAWLVSRQQAPCTPQTGPYCKARMRLPASLLRRLVRETGRGLHTESPDEWLWKGRRVKLVDGTTVSMPDTPDNQAAYPQHVAQAPGLGFPIARLVVVFCLACGAALDAALGRYQGKQAGETALLRGLDDALETGDILLGDRCYGGWFDLALLRERGIDAVVRLHQQRACDFRRGRRLGPGDHVVEWVKPARPDWMDEATYARLPERLVLREVRVRVEQAGFRTEALVVVTTLIDSTVTAEDLAELYRARWHAELDLRSLKVTLGMDVLRCKTPDMVQKEVWAHLVAYNLIRAVMARAALEFGGPPRDISFKGALQTMRAFAERMVDATGTTTQELSEWLLIAIGSYHVGDRPDRVEPRKRKRRPKHYPLLMQPRAQARAALLSNS